MEKDVELVRSIRSVIFGNGNSRKAPSLCEQGIADRLKMARLYRIVSENGMKALQADTELWDWARGEFARDRSCFEFKLWLIIDEQKAGA